ncbi:family 16 glycosylhydrolase [Nocardioides sp. C4-1]|uniref:family 16 glycosylhydrolase n=1 Tax=Nocardioides sp. C4-1 TaxID=3151851 RepID=UPI0032669F94
MGGSTWAKRALIIVVGLAATAVTTTVPMPGAAADPVSVAPTEAPAPAPAQRAAVVWSDEFDGPAGSPVDGGRWNLETGGGGWGNNEHQYYTSSTSNVAHDGQGHLAITARRENPGGYQCWYGSCQYTSARITTAGTYAPTFGRIEARIKVARGQGIWPAFWMLGQDIGSVGWPASGEIDVMENVGKDPNRVHGTVHGPGYSGGGGITGSRDLGRALADDFHTFAVDWSPGLIRWLVDDQEYHRVTPASTNGNPWVFDKPYFLILNLAVGGNWPGYPDGSTQFPQQMLVDWVRVSSTDATSPPSGNRVVSNLSGKCLDVPNGDFSDGVRLQMWGCNGSAAQRFERVGGTLRTGNGTCVDIAGGGTGDGTPVQIATCSSNPAQQWVLSGAGDLVNPQADKCLDIVDWNPGDGAQLVLWPCTGGANQKWRLE